MGFVAGVALLVALFVAPLGVEGTDDRRSDADQRRWLESVPLALYEAAEPLPGYWLSTAEGMFSSVGDVRLLYRGPGYA